MTIEEFNIYSSTAERLFAYMNGKINILNNNCHLIIEMYDLVNNTNGNTRYPNYVTIYLGTIIDSWNQKYSSIMTKHDYIGMLIAWTISHELHHADQVISMIMYKDPEYRSMVEQQVEQASHDWVHVHSDDISAIGGFNCQIKKLVSSALTGNTDYRRASVKQYYLQIIANIIIRDLDTFYSIKPLVDDNYCNNLILVFNGIEEVAIKSNGKYIEENIPLFNELVYKNAGYYDTYRLNIDCYKEIDNSSTVILRINIQDRRCNAMIFAK